MTPIITPATAKDIPDLHRMIGQLCAFHGDTLQRGLADLQRDLLEMPHIHTLIARSGDLAVGYAVIETHWRPMDSGDGCDISHLFVTERARSRGIGRQLIAAAREHARRLRAARLTIGTAPDNAGAAACYRAMQLSEITGPSGPRFRIPL